LVGAGISVIGYLILGGKALDSSEAQTLLQQYSNPSGLIMLIPVAVLLVVAVVKRNIFISITWGIVTGIIVGLVTGVLTPANIMSVQNGDLKGFLYEGILNMLGLVIYLYGVFGIMGVLQESGTMDKFITGLVNSKLAKTVAGTELIIGIGIMLSAISLGAANGPAIIMFGSVADQLGKTKKLHPYRRANLLDGLACSLPPIVPITSAFIFIVVLVVNGLSDQYSFIKPINPFQMVYATLHCWGLLIAFGISIATGWGRAYEGKDGLPVKTFAEAESK
jgi:Na+/H+ antiporter NhaC